MWNLFLHPVWSGYSFLTYRLAVMPGAGHVLADEGINIPSLINAALLTRPSTYWVTETIGQSNYYGVAQDRNLAHKYRDFTTLHLSQPAR